MDAPYEQNLDEELERPREVSNCCTEHSGGADFGCSAVNGEKKRARKPTLKVEFGWKHYIGGKFVHIKKGRGGGNQRVSMNRSATYEECLSKATGLFFPNQYCTLSDMETLRLSTYNNSYKINEEDFTVESFKERTGLTLPRLYLETKPKEQANSGPQWRSPSFDTSYTTQVNNIGSSSASEVDSGLQDLLCDTGQVSSDLDSVQLLSFFGDPNHALPACGTFHTEDSRLTTAADLDVNTMSQDIHVSQHDDLDHSVVQRHTRPSGSIETNHSQSSEGPSAPGSDLSTVHQDGDHYSGISGSVQRIYPPEGRTEGGYPFDIVLSEPLPENVTSGKAYFCHVHGGIIAELTKLGPCLFEGIVPGSPQPGVVPVTVITQTGLSLGTTYFKYIDKEHSLAMQLRSDDLNIPKLLSIMAKIPDFSKQTKQQHSVQFLQLLVYAASQTGEKRLIEIIFSTSAGQIVFNSYKDRTPLPEDVARANGHDDLANYLQDLTTRFSKEPECSLKEAHVIDWSELEAAVTAAQTQRCLSEEKSSDDSSENNSDTDYFGDVETSSIELSRTSSEDNTSKLYSRTLLYGAMVKIGQIREGVKQKSYVLILRDSHFDCTLPEVVKGLDYTLAFHLAVGSKNIPRHLHTANERFLASRERMICQPTISFYIFAELCSQLSIENTIPGEWKSSDISVKQFGAHTNFDLWVFTSAFRPTRKTLFVYFADRRDALPHNYFFQDEDCESHICCWKWKKSGNNSLKFTERLKAENQPPAKICSANPSTSTIAHNRTEGTTYPARTVSLNNASSDQSAWNRNDPVSEGVVYEKRLADDIAPHKWKELACALGFHQASIDNIQQEKGDNSKECCIEVLVRWLRQNGTGATAGKVAEALTKIELKNLADGFPIKPSDTNLFQYDKMEETVRDICEQLISLLKDSKENSKVRELEYMVSKMKNKNKELEEEVSKMKNKNKELEEEVNKMSNRIKELEEEDLEDKLSFDMNPCAVSGENDEEVRERRISAELHAFKHKPATYVTSPLEVPKVKQGQFKTPVKLVILKTLSQHLEDLYIGTQEMVSETCKCSKDLKIFYDFAYHGLRADHDELVYRDKDLEDTVQEMGEEEKEDLQKLKEFQLNRQSLIKELEEKLQALFSLRRGINERYSNPISPALPEKMSASEASLWTFDPGLEDAFEQFGPVDVDAFIDSQFNYALEGQEELQNTDFSKTAVGSRNELQMAASSTSMLHSIEFSLGGTQTNLDKANSFVSSLDELQMSGFSGMCSRCHKIMDKEDVVSYQTRKCETKERTFDPRSAIATELQLSEISDDVGTCWRELGPKLNITAAKIHNLDEDHKNNRDKANALLVMGKQQVGNSGATVGRLADHLKAIGRTSIAEKLLGVADVQLPTCSVENCDVINLTVKCDLNGELDSKVMLCEDAGGNKFLLRPVNDSMGNWNPEEIQKNKAFLETVAAAAKDMGKTPEQRRQESFKRISSEVQELQQKLKKVKLDLRDSKECTDSFTAGTNKQNDREAEKEVLDHDAKVPQQDVNHLLQSCEEQQSFCQGIYSALIKLIGEVGQPRDDNFKCILQLCNFTKELKDQEKALSPEIELLNNMKGCLDTHQTTKLEKLDKWYRAQQQQIDCVEKLLLSLLSQGSIAQNQKMLKRRSEPVLGGRPLSGFSRGRSKADSSRNSGKSPSLCPHRTSVMDTDKKLNKGQFSIQVANEATRLPVQSFFWDHD